MEEKKKARKEGGEERITRRKIADDPHEKETGTRFSFLFSFFFKNTRATTRPQHVSSRDIDKSKPKRIRSFRGCVITEAPHTFHLVILVIFLITGIARLIIAITPVVPLGLLLLLLPPFESKYTSQSMAGTRGRRGCSRRAFHLRPSRDHALPPKRVFAFKSPVGDAALSLSPRDPEFSLLLLRIISLHLATAILLSPAFLDRKRRPVRNATYIAPISSILISHLLLPSRSFPSFRLRTRTKKIGENCLVVVAFARERQTSFLIFSSLRWKHDSA